MEETKDDEKAEGMPHPGPGIHRYWWTVVGKPDTDMSDMHAHAIHHPTYWLPSAEGLSGLSGQVGGANPVLSRLCQSGKAV